MFWAEAIDGRLNFMFSSERYLAHAVQVAAHATNDGGDIRVYERVQTYEVHNGRKSGI